MKKQEEIVVYLGSKISRFILESILDIKIETRIKWIMHIPFPLIDIFQLMTLSTGLRLKRRLISFYFPHSEWVNTLVVQCCPTDFCLLHQKEYLEHLNWIRAAYGLPHLAWFSSPCGSGKLPKNKSKGYFYEQKKESYY